MSAPESYLYTNPDHGTFPYASWNSIRASEKVVTSFPVRRLSGETTTTVPPRISVAEVDCFDTCYIGRQNSPAQPSTVFLDFEEFQGYSPRIPLLVKVEFNDGLCEIEHSELGVFGRGESCFHSTL